MKAIIFDMDGTIVRSEKFHFKAFQTIFKEVGLKFTEAIFKKKYSGTGSEYIFKDMFRVNKVKKDPYHYIEKKKKLFQEYLVKHKLQIVPGFKQFFKKAKENKIKMGIASGTNIENIGLTLKNVGYDKEFKVITSGTEVKKPKPAPDVFLLAAKRLRVEPEKCVAFEDAVLGIESAKKAKMYVIGLATTNSAYALKKAGADKVVKDFREIKLEKLMEVCDQGEKSSTKIKTKSKKTKK